MFGRAVGVAKESVDGISVLKRLHWKELTSRPVGLKFHGRDACPGLKSRG